MRKVLECEEVAFRYYEHREALRVIVSGEQRTLLVVVPPIGKGKSSLFRPQACLDDYGVTIIVVPYRALVNNLVITAKRSARKEIS
jgi:superfamily II DNA helicase RecQ